MQLLSALVVAELDSLVDEMSYDELYEAFGGGWVRLAGWLAGRLAGPEAVMVWLVFWLLRSAAGCPSMHGIA